MKSRLLLFVSVLIMNGCASVIEGDSQELIVHSQPEGATCSLSRNGSPLGTIAQTPDAIYIKKTKDDIVVSCGKDGYQNTDIVLKSEYPKNNWLYILVGGPVGWGIDSASGADNLYASPATVPLNPQ